MRLRTPLLLLTAAAVLMPGTAHAAVPKTKATLTLPCPEGPGVARIWSTKSRGWQTKLAVDNPCGQWLGWAFGGQAYNGSSDSAMMVAPGAHFNWGKKRIANYYSFEGRAAFGPVPECAGTTSISLVYSYKDVRDVPTRCNDPAPNATLDCRGSGEARLSWDAERLVVTNPCDQWVNIVIQYETPDRGNDTTMVQVLPGESLDQTWDLLGMGDADAEPQEWYLS